MGHNVFPGETFIIKANVKQCLLFSGWSGNTKLGNDDHFTITLGSGYRIILKDWLTFNLDARDMSFESKVLGTTKQTHNLEFSAGLTAFF